MAINDFGRLNPATLARSVLEHLAGVNPSREYVQETLNAALKARLAEALTAAGHPELIQLIQVMGPVDIASNKDLSLRAFFAQQVASLLPSNGPTRSAVEAALATLSDTTTLGALLGLDTPIQDHPLFRDAGQQAVRSDEIARLHKVLGQLGFQLPAAEVERNIFGLATQQAVQQFQQQHGLVASGTVDERTVAALNAAVAAIAASKVPAAARTTGATSSLSGERGAAPPPPGSVKPEESSAYQLQGRLAFDYGLPAGGITVRLYHIGFGGQAGKRGETTSDSQGQYSLSYEPGQDQVLNLQVRVLDPQGQEVTISATKFNAQPHDVLNLIVPARVRPLAPEFDRLVADVAPHIGGIGNLGQAQESASRQDLTLLSASTHWDARLLALAATAVQRAPAAGLGQEALYALFRVGLPSAPQHLAMVPSDTVRQALTRASQAGIVGMNNQQIAAAVTAFEVFAAKTRLTLAAPGSSSSFGELLSAVITDPAQQIAFANLYFSQSATDGSFWQQAANLQIPAKTLDALKLQGKFLYLTFNNSRLAQKLQQDIGSVGNMPQLVDKDYYGNAAWKSTLIALAGSSDGPALDKLIPPAYKGKTTTDRLEAYAADLARKVRFSFPTHVVARMIERRELSVDQATAANVTAFLRAAAALGYELGRTPLNRLLKDLAAAKRAPSTAAGTQSSNLFQRLLGQSSANGAAQPSAASVPTLDAASIRSLKTLHRLYQVTPSTESLQAALTLGFTSARDIASHTRDDFMNRFASAFPSSGEAALVYAKAQQISSVTFNVLTMARLLDAAPPVYGMSGPANGRQHARDALVQQFPAMASVFGSTNSHPA